MNTEASAMSVHRLLDEAFAGIDVTADVQDLKEEIRANLVVRVGELEGSGLPADTAAQRAMDELGDVRSIVEETATAGPTAPWARHRVRPRPAFVVRTVSLAALGVAALGTAVVPLVGPAVPLALHIAAIGVVALVTGVLVGDGLRQETTTSYPVPVGRAVGYGLASTLAVAGAGAAALYLPGRALPWLVGGGVALVAAVVGFAYLGATQTNRHKPWVVRARATQPDAGDRFEQDPAAAARFGLYTVVIWLVAFAAFAVASFTVGWAWSWLALLGGVVAMMVTLARTLFAPDAPAASQG